LSKRFALISSTGASVVKAVYLNTNRSEFDLDLIIVDRNCGAKEFGLRNGIRVDQIASCGKKEVSQEILSILRKEKIDYVYLFFTRLLEGKLLTEYSERIINFHPSLLPSCPGLHGFEDTLKSGALLAGSTVHFVDAGIDTGKIIQQGFAPVRYFDKTKLRHRIFSQQCASLFSINQKIKQGISLIDFKLHDCDLGQGFLPNLNEESFNFYQVILNQA
jgi:phosphoribosylglycinamide formyltransferase-1